MSGRYSYFDNGQYLVLSDASALNISDSGINAIDVDWVSGSVAIGCGEGGDIIVKEEIGGKKSQNLCLRYFVDGDVLKIRFAENGAHIPSFFQKNLTVSLPAGMALTQLKVSSISGKVKAEHITSEEMKFNGVSCKITALNINSDVFVVENVSGNIDLTGKVVRKAEINTVSGGFAADLTSAPASVAFNSVSGGAEMTIPDNDGFTVDFRSVSGKLANGFSSHNVYGNGAARYGFSTVSGNVRIKNRTVNK